MPVFSVYLPVPLGQQCSYLCTCTLTVTRYMYSETPGTTVIYIGILLVTLLQSGRIEELLLSPLISHVITAIAGKSW